MRIRRSAPFPSEFSYLRNFCYFWTNESFRFSVTGGPSEFCIEKTLYWLVLWALRLSQTGTQSPSVFLKWFVMTDFDPCPSDMGWLDKSGYGWGFVCCFVEVPSVDYRPRTLLIPATAVQRPQQMEIRRHRNSLPGLRILGSIHRGWIPAQKSEPIEIVSIFAHQLLELYCRLSL